MNYCIEYNHQHHTSCIKVMIDSIIAEWQSISRLFRNQETVDRTYDNILARYLENNTGDSDGALDRDCYFSVVRHVHDFCFNLGENSEALQKIQRLKGLCFKGDKRPALKGLKTLIKEVCYNLW